VAHFYFSHKTFKCHSFITMDNLKYVTSETLYRKVTVVNEDETDGVCGVQVEEEEYLQGFGGET
jgi:hypothetical protein